MNLLGSLARVLAVGLLLALLAWLGWRYFAPLPCGSRADRVPPDGAAQAPSPRRRALRGIWSWLGHRAVLLALLCAALGIAGPMALGRRVDPGPLVLLEFEGGDRIRRHLDPERLVPPPPLPPSLFVGTERPGLESADRDWTKLESTFAQQLLRLLARLEARGYPFVLLEGYRSPARQEWLAALGPAVTRARAMQSRHQFGLAADLAPLRDGRLVLSERDPWAWQAYQALGEEAEALGLIWGGRWSLRDYSHVEAATRAVTLHGARP